VTLLLLPTLSSKTGGKPTPGDITSQAGRLALLFGGATLLYCVLVSVFSRFILNLVYAGKYNDTGLLVFLFALANVAVVVIQILTVVLKAHRDTRSTVSVWIISTAIVMVLSIPAMKLWGLDGAMSTAVVSYLVSAVIALVMVKRADARLSGRTG
jgi:O-antigen/teichoic acid export membrane protein